MTNVFWWRSGEYRYFRLWRIYGQIGILRYHPSRYLKSIEFKIMWEKDEKTDDTSR